MELEEFISKTLVSIMKGVKSANRELKESESDNNAYLLESASNHKDRTDGYIKFDVAVTAVKESGASGTAGIKVWSVGIGGKKETNSSDEVVSRIKFGIAPHYTTG